MHVAAATLGQDCVRLAQSLHTMDPTALTFLTQSAPHTHRAVGLAVLDVDALNLLQKTNAIKRTSARFAPPPSVVAAGRDIQNGAQRAQRMARLSVDPCVSHGNSLAK
jgi:hypothetical protein